MNLVEQYKNRLSVSESIYTKKHEDTAMTMAQKKTIAQVLANTSKFLTEAFGNSVGTQRADMAEFKKFTLDITTVALPSLIANELVLVKPMQSFTGFIQYISFDAGSTKGDVARGDVFNDPFHLAPMTEGRMNYTASKVVEPVAAAATSFTPAWTPVVGDKVIGIAADGTETELTLVNGSVAITAGAYEKIKYEYNNIIIPQDDLPILNAHVEGLSLRAKARRIAIYYSQMAAFQAKQEMGIALGEVLEQQACAELTHEIDAEIIMLLNEGAKYSWTKVGEEFVKGALRPVISFNKMVPVGVSKAQHYEGFLETLEECGNVVYKETQKYNINYVVCARDVINVVSFINGWRASNAKPVGPYYAGSLNGIKFYVSPALGEGEFFAGFHGDDLMTSAAIYAPYMALVPTMALEYADGGNSKGFSTLYDAKLLNPRLLVPGKVVKNAGVADQTVAVING